MEIAGAFSFCFLVFYDIAIEPILRTMFVIAGYGDLVLLHGVYHYGCLWGWRLLIVHWL